MNHAARLLLFRATKFTITEDAVTGTPAAPPTATLTVLPADIELVVCKVTAVGSGT